MKLIKFVIDSKEKSQYEQYVNAVNFFHDSFFFEDSDNVMVEMYNPNDKRFTFARQANKMLNDYAVTQLPFVLLVDSSKPEGEQEYAAVYSEEGPITIERIKAKL